MHAHASAQRHAPRQHREADLSRRSAANTASPIRTSPALTAQRQTVDLIKASPRVTAQRQQIQGYAVVQRWPGITSDAGTFQYRLGGGFSDRHVAASKGAATQLAWQLYDPHHRSGSHSAYVTVIYPDLSQVQEGTDTPASGGYHWALQIDADAVCVGPRGYRNHNGDPGAKEDISSVIVSGYNTPTGRLITHISTSQ